MNDLISRKALKDFIINAIDKQNGRGIDLLKVSEVIAVIDNQPTAFDTEKVVEQLDEASYLVKPRGRSSTDYADTVVYIGEAIDIVKKGGVE